MTIEEEVHALIYGPKAVTQHFTCSMCTSEHPSRDDYAQHLIERHGDTWLARRVLRQQTEALRAAKNATPE